VPLGAGDVIDRAFLDEQRFCHQRLDPLVETMVRDFARRDFIILLRQH
jgi:hypothetical protein